MQKYSKYEINKKPKMNSVLFHRSLIENCKKLCLYIIYTYYDGWQYRYCVNFHYRIGIPRSLYIPTYCAVYSFSNLNFLNYFNRSFYKFTVFFFVIFIFLVTLKF